MADVVETTRARVQKYLTEDGPISIDGDGDFFFDHGSTRVYIRVMSFGEHAVVNVFAPVLLEVVPTPDLYAYLADTDFVFGHLSLDPAGSADRRNLVFAHRVLGDYLDPDELFVTVAAVATTADDLDDELQPRFGGNRLGE